MKMDNKKIAEPESEKGEANETPQMLTAYGLPERGGRGESTKKAGTRR